MPFMHNNIYLHSTGLLSDLRSYLTYFKNIVNFFRYFTKYFGLNKFPSQYMQHSVLQHRICLTRSIASVCWWRWTSRLLQFIICGAHECHLPMRVSSRGGTRWQWTCKCRAEQSRLPRAFARLCPVTDWLTDWLTARGHCWFAVSWSCVCASRTQAFLLSHLTQRKPGRGVRALFGLSCGLRTAAILGWTSRVAFRRSVGHVGRCSGIYVLCYGPPMSDSADNHANLTEKT